MRRLETQDRNVPEVFWYAKGMGYAVQLQDKPAPLIFLVAGTGARHDASKMLFLERLFYAQGYHVVGLTSPTHFNFLVNASKHAIAGYVPFDVDDLWRVMRWIREDLEQECEITGYRLAGYSLGGLQSAFLAERDSRERVFDFENVLLINPAVDLYSSALTFESWLAGPGQEALEQAVQILVKEFTEFYKNNDVGNLDGEAILAFFQDLNLTDAQMRALIAASFRMTAASMIFTSDVCMHAGYIVPADKALTSTDPLLPYFDAASQITFKEYFEEFLYPYIRYVLPGMSQEQALAECSLRRIEEFLQASPKVFVVGNADDPILQPEEVDFLRSTFGERVALFPHGGHCGNLNYVRFAEKMLEFSGPEGN